MSPLFFSILVGIVTLFHYKLQDTIRRGRIKEGFCTLWLIDTLFALCGLILSFYLYHYRLWEFLTLRNLLLLLLYTTAAFLLFVMAPSGLTLFTQKHSREPEQILAAEYRFNHTLRLVCRFFLVLFFLLPLFLQILSLKEEWYRYLLPAGADKLCGGVYLLGFSFLLPIYLRQTFFWLKHLQSSPLSTEEEFLRNYTAEIHYRTKNRL